MHGAILELRLIARGVSNTQADEFVISLRNVGKQPVLVPNYQASFANVLVRDRFGSGVEMTEKGLEYLSFPAEVSSRAILKLQPGYAWGFAYPLRQHFRLVDGQTYTIVGRNHFDGDVCGEVVASPLTQELRDDGTITDERGTPRPRPKAGATVANSPLITGDKDWARLLPKAGEMRRGCVLDAMTLPEDPKNLVASLTCLSVTGNAPYSGDWEPGKHYWLVNESADGRVDAGRQAADYRVLVVGPDGKSIPLTAAGRADIAAPGPEMCERLRKYSAIGAIIPLTKWFDLKKSGEYTVLVTLKAPDETESQRPMHYDGDPEPPPGTPTVNPHGPLWVAKPIRVHVPIKTRGG